MPREIYTASEAAQRLGISLDTLRRWDRNGRIKTSRDKGNRRVVSAKEVDRLRGNTADHHISARNRFSGIVNNVKVEGLMAQIEMVVTEPMLLTAVVTRDAVEDLGIEAGQHLTAVIKSTSVMVEQ